MKIALVFWGLTRSLKHTIKSIEDNIFNIFKLNNIEYHVYLHTYKFNQPYNNKRANEINISLNFDEYKLLKPNFFIFDDYNEILNEINLKLYHTKKDPWNSNYQTLNNFVLAMYSKYKITQLLEDNIKNDNQSCNNLYQKKINQLTNEIKIINLKINKLNIINNNSIIKNEIDKLIKTKDKLLKIIEDLTEDSNLIQNNFNLKYDYIIFLRPDVKYLNKFDINWLKLIDDSNICIPNFCIFNNFNDRFFLSNVKNGIIYGKLFEKLYQYSLKNELHSETFHYKTLTNDYDIKINLIKFYFNRVRANGKHLSSDFKNRRVNYTIIK